MSDDGYAVGRIGELESGGWAPLRRHFGVEAFGVNAWVAKEAGELIVAEHDETTTGHEELYVVMRGEATFRTGGEEHPAPEGSVLFVRDQSVRRAVVAHEPGTTILSIGGKRGEAYASLPWESNYDAILLFNEEDYDGAKRVLLDALERRPDNPGYLYNLACAEARLGEADAALEHLAVATAAEQRFFDAAQTDDDLVSIRDDPRFPASRPAA
jgi:tetratricopeptide (TPR) repeat protein